MWQSLVFVTAWLTLATNLVARDIFVNNVGGSDVQNGAAPDSKIQGNGPVRTIAQGLRLAEKGDRLVLANTGEPYRESITLQGGRHSGHPDEPFEVVGNGAVLDGSLPVPSEAWEHVRASVFRFPPRRKSYQQLFLDDLPLTRRDVGPSGLPQLQPLEWCLFDRHIYFRAEDDRIPQNYRLTHAGPPVGITLYEVRHVVVRDLTVQGFQLDGINAHDNVFGSTIANCVCRGNGRSGISVGGASRVRLDSCLIGNNGTAQIRTEGYSKTWIINCDLLENPAPKLVQEGGQVFVEDQPADAASK
jgi:hypothetical protein